MNLELVLENTANGRPGYELVSFKEAGLPIFVLTLRVLILERKALGPIEEGVLKAVRAGLSAPADIVQFLGLPRAVLIPVLAGLNTTELINYSKGAGDAAAMVTLSTKGRLALAEAATVTPQERTVRVCFDALTQKLLFVAPEQLLKAREMRGLGYFEVPTGSSKRPEIEDVPLQEFDKVLKRQRAQQDAHIELLGIRRIERRELHYAGCVMLFYRNQTQISDIQVAFWREDGAAIEHETRFRAIGGPDLVGARLLETPVDIAAEFGQLVELADGDTGGASLDVVQEVATNGTKGMPNDAEIQPEAGIGETMQRLLCHDHPPLLKKALTSSKKRLVIISPWISHYVVDWGFVSSLRALLNNRVEVYIGYGIDEADGDGKKKSVASSKPAITPEAERDLKELAGKYSNFHLVYIGNTHRKSLVSDDSFAVLTSFNWLSFKGDSRGRPRDESGYVLRKKRHVDAHFEDDLKLLKTGYPGGVRGARDGAKGQSKR